MFKWLWNDFNRRVIHNKRGVIGTTAAIIAGTAAVASAGAAAYSSRQQRKAAEAQIEEQRRATEATRAETIEERAFQREIAEPELEFQQRQLGLFKEVFEPGVRALAPEIEAQLRQPLSLPPEVFEELFQRGRERIGAEFGALTEKTTQRLAGAGPGVLRGRQAQELFADIERERVRSIEDLAVDQAIFEFQEKKVAQQQALENAFRFLGAAPRVGSPQVPSISSPSPFVAPQIPPQSLGIGEGVETGLRVASLFGSKPGLAGPGGGVDIGGGRSVPSPEIAAQMGFIQPQPSRLGFNANII